MIYTPKKAVASLAEAVEETNQYIIENFDEEVRAKFEVLNNSSIDNKAEVIKKFIEDSEKEMELLNKQLTSCLNRSKTFDKIQNTTKKFINKNTGKTTPFTLYTFANTCTGNTVGRIHSLCDTMLSLASTSKYQALITVVDLNQPDNLDKFMNSPFRGFILDNNKSEFVLTFKDCVVDFKVRKNFLIQIDKDRVIDESDKFQGGFKDSIKLIQPKQYGNIITSLVNPDKFIVRSTYSTSNAKYGMDTFPYLYELFESTISKTMYREHFEVALLKALMNLIKKTRDLPTPFFEQLPRKSNDSNDLDDVPHEINHRNYFDTFGETDPDELRKELEEQYNEQQMI